MSQRRFTIVSVLLLLVLASIACGSPPVGSDPDETPTTEALPEVTEVVGTGEPIPTTAAGATGQPTNESSATCPAAQPGTLVYINEQGGYCFLYPETFDTVTDQYMGPYDVNVVGPPLDESMEPALAWMSVNLLGRPGMVTNMTVAQYVDEELAYLGLPDLPRQETTLGGQPAVIVEGIPRRGTARAAYVVANSTILTITVEPTNNELPVAQPDSDLVWSTVTGSLTFFNVPLQDVVTPEEECPAAAEGSVLYVNRRDGYCFLYPSTFGPETEFGAGWFVGGPEFEGYPEFPSTNRVRLAIGLVGPQDEGETVDQRVTNYLINSVEGQYTREDITIGGNPAVVIKDTSPPVAEWTAYVYANGLFYTMLISPTDFTVTPEAQEPVEAMWGSLTSTMQFFEAWR